MLQIASYMNSLVSTYPNLVSLVNIGRSFQNRPLAAVKVWIYFHLAWCLRYLNLQIGNPGSNKPAVWIDGGIHAREWLTTATMIYIMNEVGSAYV